MRITREQMAFYAEHGFLLLAAAFTQAEVDRLKSELPGLLEDDSERRVLEKDAATVRSVYAAHRASRSFADLVADARLVMPARQMVGAGVYLHQCKVNLKAGFGGDSWSWHQDYIFWSKEDGIPRPDLVTAAVFLDDVTDVNGPLFLVPGSHRAGMVDMAGHTGQPTGDAHEPDWMSHLSRDLKYSLSRRAVAEFAGRFGIVAPKGPAGSILFFHPNLFHASPPNMSPFDRAVAFLTYNSVDNTSTCTGQGRPDFLCSRDYTPLKAGSVR